ASGCLGKNVERRDQSSLRITGKRRVADAHGKIRSPVLHSDPRRAVAFSSSGRQSNCGATGESFNKISPFFEQCKADLAHASGDAGDSDIGVLASGAMLPVQPAEVSRATNRYPGRFNEGPLQRHLLRLLT